MGTLPSSEGRLGLGVASTEIPWLGSIKLLTTGAWPAVWLLMDQVEYSSRRHSGRPSDLRCFEGRSEEPRKQDGDKDKGEDE